MHSKKTKITSTYERLIHEDPTFEQDLDIEYRAFILSELLMALIQDLRTGKRDNLILKSVSNIVDSLNILVKIWFSQETRRDQNKLVFIEQHIPKGVSLQNFPRHRKYLQGRER